MLLVLFYCTFDNSLMLHLHRTYYNYRPASVARVEILPHLLRIGLHFDIAI